MTGNSWAFYAYGTPAPLPKHICEGYTSDPSGCWLWTRSKSPDGYGWTSYKNKTYQAHRFVYQWVRGPIPDGLHLDHLCRVRHCVNPDHLEPVTPAENVRRGSPGRSWWTTCKRGHQLAQLPSGHRTCRICNAARARRYRQEATHG
jgi:hypothetical protein